MNSSEVIELAFHRFQPSDPELTLRQANEVDSYRDPSPKTSEESLPPTDQYLESHHFGIPHLDPVSWRYYLPYLTSYALRNMSKGDSLVIHGFLQSLRPPDRTPPRFAVLDGEQEKVIISLLELLGFDRQSGFQEDALQILEEYWIPNAIYRK
jgi:hypothetical protein